MPAVTGEVTLRAVRPAAMGAIFSTSLGTPWRMVALASSRTPSQISSNWAWMLSSCCSSSASGTAMPRLVTLTKRLSALPMDCDTMPSSAAMRWTFRRRSLPSPPNSRTPPTGRALRLARTSLEKPPPTKAMRKSSEASLISRLREETASVLRRPTRPLRETCSSSHDAFASTRDITELSVERKELKTAGKIVFTAVRMENSTATFMPAYAAPAIAVPAGITAASAMACA
mmetsp:Transcript_4102/g.11888  ORF Transcript_4102/g.11888 Transcript_4102/m.11888 type:complete len:230 (+) Transcript_4102:2769-3458(+)